MNRDVGTEGSVLTGTVEPEHDLVHASFEPHDGDVTLLYTPGNGAETLDDVESGSNPSCTCDTTYPGLGWGG